MNVGFSKSKDIGFKGKCLLDGCCFLKWREKFPACVLEHMTKNIRIGSEWVTKGWDVRLSSGLMVKWGNRCCCPAPGSGARVMSLVGITSSVWEGKWEKRKLSKNDLVFCGVVQ